MYLNKMIIIYLFYEDDNILIINYIKKNILIFSSKTLKN